MPKPASFPVRGGAPAIPERLACLVLGRRCVVRKILSSLPGLGEEVGRVRNCPRMNPWAIACRLSEAPGHGQRCRATDLADQGGGGCGGNEVAFHNDRLKA